MAKQKKMFLSVFAAILFLVLVIPTVLFIHDRFVDNGKNIAELYLIGPNQKIKILEKEIPDATPEEVVKVILEDLRVGAKADGMSSTIPETLEVKDITIENRIVTIDFSSGYYVLSSKEEVICRSSVVWSLTSLGFVDSVVFTVEGSPLYSNDGALLGAMNRANVLIDPSVSATTTEYTILKLYFANSDATDLVVEERVVEVDTNQPRETTILQQLIEGPKEAGHYPTIPPETKIMDITTTNDGVCYVNLSQEFVTKHGGGSTSELLTIYSIVNSLSELETVDKVQFLIEGEKLETFKGHVDFSTPFVAVETLNTVSVNE
ncbi:MAG: GerMN domain-containing protein [Anaerotignum sp.]